MERLSIWLERLSIRWTERLMRGWSPEDFLDQIVQLESFARCRVKTIVDFDEGMPSVGVILDWPYLDRYQLKGWVYGRRKAYEDGQGVQIVRCLRSSNEQIRDLMTTITIPPFGVPYQTVTHDYLARPTADSSDLWNEAFLSKIRKVLPLLDPVFFINYHGL